MPPPVAELLVNLRHDDQFGLVMTLGAGGVLVELLTDTQTLLLPSGDAAILTALQNLRIYPLLTGYRGAAAVNIPALLRALAQLALAFQTLSATLAEIEINPLFVCVTGTWVVDALIPTIKD